MDSYQANTEGTITIPADFSLFLCYSEVSDALAYLESDIIPAYTEEAAVLNDAYADVLAAEAAAALAALFTPFRDMCNFCASYSREFYMCTGANDDDYGYDEYSVWCCPDIDGDQSLIWPECETSREENSCTPSNRILGESILTYCP